MDLTTWINAIGLDDRTKQHIAFAVNYVENFAHGAPGHLDLTVIAQLSKQLSQTVGFLEAAQARVQELEDQLKSVQDLAKAAGIAIDL
jgi:hypothetical protein